MSEEQDHNEFCTRYRKLKPYIEANCFRESMASYLRVLIKYLANHAAPKTSREIIRELDLASSTPRNELKDVFNQEPNLRGEYYWVKEALTNLEKDAGFV